jgi:hypothetical protein
MMAVVPVRIAVECNELELNPAMNGSGYEILIFVKCNSLTPEPIDNILARPNPAGIDEFRDESEVQSTVLHAEDPTLIRRPEVRNEIVPWETVT